MEDRIGDAPSAAPRIALNGRALDGVKIRMPRPAPNTVSALSLPARWHRASREGEVLVIDTSALVVVQLFFEGVLTADRRVQVQVRIGDDEPASMTLEGLEALDRRTVHDEVRLRLRATRG